MELPGLPPGSSKRSSSENQLNSSAAAITTSQKTSGTRAYLRVLNMIAFSNSIHAIDVKVFCFDFVAVIAGQKMATAVTSYGVIDENVDSARSLNKCPNEFVTGFVTCFLHFPERISTNRIKAAFVDDEFRIERP